MSPKQVIFKAAQIGFSTLAVVKSMWISRYRKMDIIYTLPTESDRNEFVSGKVNRIIAQNTVLQQYTKDKDSVEQKKIGENLIYYRGTWTQKAAIMIPSDLNIYDEVDASKPDVIEQYSTRLQHSKYKWEWYFSHPSAAGAGVDRYWNRSDQKHWFITCGQCQKEQYMNWPQSFDMQRKTYICKFCHKDLTEAERREGRWVKKYKDREFSGYWIPLFICPWVPAKDIIAYHDEKSDEYFFNKVLGLPYVGGGNKLTRQLFMQNLTTDDLYPGENEMVMGGLDTGTQLYLVLGSVKGLFYYGVAKDYDEIDVYMKRWPRLKIVVDQGGDLIGSRKLRERWPGRVFLCSFAEDRKGKQLTRWGKGDEAGSVIADRNRCIQMVVSEFSEKRLPVMGGETDWEEYYTHWNNLTRIKEIDPKTGLVKRRIWVKNGQSDFSFATVYWRICRSRFGGKGSVIPLDTPVIRAQRGVEIGPMMEVRGRPPESIWDMQQQSDDDWRNT